MAVTSNRGQMLLLGAVVLAVLFVSLSFVLNGSIQTTTYASEASADVSESGSVSLHQETRRNVASLMRTARNEHPDDFGEQRDFIEPNVTALGQREAKYYAGRDRIVTYESIDVVEGRHIEHSGGDFTSSASPVSVASSTELRKFEIDPSNWGSLSNPFLITISDTSSTDSWTIEIDDSGDTVRVTGTTSGTCDTTASSPTIEVTNATLAGDPCPALEFFEDVNTYDVSFENGNEIEGTYSFFAEGTAVHNPAGEEVVYGVRVSIAERSPQIDYVRTIEVAPGEPR